MEMSERADALQDNASQFEMSTAKLKNKFWMENLKYLVLTGALLVLLIVVLVFVYKSHVPTAAEQPSDAGQGEIMPAADPPQT